MSIASPAHGTRELGDGLVDARFLGPPSSGVFDALGIVLGGMSPLVPGTGVAAASPQQA